jgi:hypothetical protein
MYQASFTCPRLARQEDDPRRFVTTANPTVGRIGKHIRSQNAVV